MAESLRLALLGEPQLTERDKSISGFISAKAEALLYYLALTGEIHSRDVLAALLWGDMPEASARKNLTKALSNLRKLVGPYLTVDYHSAGLKPDSAYWLDVRFFEEAVQSNAIEGLQQAVALYRGDFLEGFYVKDSPTFETWLRSEQERLRRLMEQALETLAVQLAANDARTALSVTRRLLEMDPYRETAHRQLMILLARDGQRSAALAQYKACRRILAKELGVEPSAETETLYNRIKTGGASPPHNLPHPTITFVGREVELSRIIALLTVPGCRLLTIAGPGGIGKTRLALQAATHYAQEITFDPEWGFPDGVYLIRLAALDSIEAVISTLAETLGFSFHKESEPEQQVLNFFRQRRLLLVMDNFEQFLVPTSPSTQGRSEGVKLIITILETAPNVKILTTSRSRLNLQGEHIYYLAGISFPDWKTSSAEQVASTGPPNLPPAKLVKAAVGYGAIQLFANQARQARPDFELTANNVLSVVKICRLVQGMPLAILLAAAWVELLTPAEIALEIARNLDFLETSMSDLPPRQQSIRAAFDYSWSLLTNREREIFQQLSTFQSDFSRQAAQAVTGTSLKELMALMNKSLLRRTASGQYVIHGLLRQYAAEKLDQTSDGGQATRNKHSAYYVDMLHQFEQDLKGPRQQATLAEIDAEGENIRAAWNWAITRHQAEWLSRAADGLGYFYLWRGRYREGETAFRTATTELGNNVSPEPAHLLAKLATWQAVFSNQLGQADLAAQLLNRSLASLDDSALTTRAAQATRAFTLLQLGEISREVDRQAARRRYEQSLALYQSLDDSWGTANTLASLGWLIQHFGAYDEARHLYAESLTLRQLLEDRWGLANSLISLASVSLYQGHPDEAKQLIQQSITLHRELNDRVGIAYSLGKLGETLIWLGRFVEAPVPLAESKALYDDLGLRDRAAFAVAMLAHARLHQGKYEQAFQQARAALAEFHPLGSRRGRGYALLAMGWAQLGLDQPGEAQRLLQDSQTHYQELGQRDELAQAMALLGYAAYRLNEPELAHQYLVEALRTAYQIKAYMPMMLALPVLALLLMDQNKPEPAAELHALATRYPFVANSRWFEAMTALPDATLNLAPDVLAAARARGSARALETTVAEIIRPDLANGLNLP